MPSAPCCDQVIPPCSMRPPIDVLAGAFDCSTANGEMHLSVAIVVHPVLVLLEVVQLPLEVVTLGPVDGLVANLA
jgi:hypothetical protein